MQNPPEWFSEWYTFLIVQVAGLIAAGIAVWKWLTKPLRADNKKTSRRLILLKRMFKKESFDIRTAAGSIQRMSLENEKRIDKMDHQLETLQFSVDRMEAVITDGFQDLRDRLTSLETEVRVRVEQQRDHKRRDPDAHDKR